MRRLIRMENIEHFCVKGSCLIQLHKTLSPLIVTWHVIAALFLLTRSLGRSSFMEAEHATQLLHHSRHLRNDWQVVDDEVHFLLLHLHEVSSMTQESESRDISASVSLIFVHQARRCNVQNKEMQ